MQLLADKYSSKKITNLQMLLEMGKVYLNNPENIKVKTDYFNRMIISGYTSWVLHHYLSNHKNNISAEDQKIILFALSQGNHYDLAKEFADRFDGNYKEKLKEIILINDSLNIFSQMLRNGETEKGYSYRGNLFARIGEKEMAAFDLDRALGFEPCNPDALFRRALVLFEKEQNLEIIRLLNECKNITPKPDWFDIFYTVAGEAEKIQKSTEPKNDKFFKLANLYVNNGFNDLALRNSNKLIEIDPNNPDYLALQAFIHYRKGNKSLALQFISQAENRSGQKSRLREMIEQMNEL